MYKKPEVKIIEVSDKDIIQTSPTTITPGGNGTNDNPIEWSLRSQSDADGNVFQK